MAQNTRITEKNADFINHTTLSNSIIKKGCGLTVSPALRMVYLLAGIAIGISAVVFRICFGTPTLATILVLLLGLIIVWQGTRLPMESARAMISHLMKLGDEARERTYYANADGLTVVATTKPFNFRWVQVRLAVASQEITCLVMKDGDLLFIMDNDGFSKGTAKEFQSLLAAKVESPKQNWFSRWATHTVTRLDNWRLVQLAYKQEQEQKKAVKFEKHKARKK